MCPPLAWQGSPTNHDEYRGVPAPGEIGGGGVFPFSTGVLALTFIHHAGGKNKPRMNYCTVFPPLPTTLEFMDQQNYPGIQSGQPRSDHEQGGWFLTQWRDTRPRGPPIIQARTSVRRLSDDTPCAPGHERCSACSSAPTVARCQDKHRLLAGPSALSKTRMLNTANLTAD